MHALRLIKFIPFFVLILGCFIVSAQSIAQEDSASIEVKLPPLPSTSDSVASEPMVTDPNNSKSNGDDSFISESDFDEPEVTEMETTEPEITESEITEPVSKEPRRAEPVAEIQADTLKEKQWHIRPKIGIGVGMMNYQGDLVASRGYFNPFQNRTAFQVNAAQALNDQFDLNFFMLY